MAKFNKHLYIISRIWWIGEGCVVALVSFGGGVKDVQIFNLRKYIPLIYIFLQIKRESKALIN